MLPPAIRPYLSITGELTIDDGVIMKGHKAVILGSLQTVYFDAVHKGHPGAESTVHRTRGMFFWPAMSDNIHQRVQSCTTPHQQRETLLLHQVPNLPWTLVASDIFDWRSQHYLVLVDSYSGWYEIDLLHTITSAAVTLKLRRHFSVHGAQHTLLSDNAGQFTSQQFKDFAAQWNFKHITSIPDYPQLNGLAERAVCSAKQVLDKSYIRVGRVLRSPESPKCSM